MARRRPQHIQELIRSVNFEMARLKLKYEESNRLFFVIQDYLLSHGWYRGFNFYDADVAEINGEIRLINRLHGSDEGYEYVQFE